MANPRAPGAPLCVLVLAPTGRDEEVLVQTLSSAGLIAEACSSMPRLCRRIERGAGAAVIADEALSSEDRRRLEETLRRQPEWSDFPLIIMSSNLGWHRPGPRFTRSDSASYAMILERPVYRETLLSTMYAALRSRLRQYQVRDELVERRRTEEALRESEARFREMADGLPLIVWVHDASGDQTMVNRTFCEFFGVTREEMKGERWQMLTHPEDGDAYIDEFRACLKERRPFHSEVRVKRSDGEWRWIESWGRPRSTSSGDFHGFVGASVDITDRKRIEEQLRQADRRKDEFLAVLAHELRNPLAAIRNATDLLKLTAPKGERRLERTHSVLDRQTRHMSRLIDGLLEVSRVSRGKIHLEREPLDLRRIIEHVLQDRAPQMEEHGLELRRDLPDRPVWVWGDPVRLAQTLDNLIGNAIKFTSAPGTVTLSLNEEGGCAVARVRDTGIGIPPEMLSRIFEPFQQETEGRPPAAGGLGLGLALARGLVELHGGDLRARSQGPDTGSEFEVRLPLTSAPVAERPEQRKAEVIPPSSVLLVEDNPDAGQTLRELMEMCGHDVFLVETGSEALEVLRRRGADIVLCDLGLPDMSGYEVARAVRGDSELRDTPLVALSGYGQPEDAKRSNEAGFDDHMTKPASIQDLHAVIARLVRPARARR